MNVLHDNVRQSTGGSHIENRRDMRVIQLANYFGFLEKKVYLAVCVFLASHWCHRFQALDCDCSFDGGIEREINHPCLA